MNYKELLEINDELYQDSKKQVEANLRIINSIDRTMGICENNRSIVDKIDDSFLDKVKLTKNDLPFLFLAIGLQTVRWFLMPSFDFDYSKISKDERLQANEVKHQGKLEGYRSGQRYEKPEINRYKRNHQDKYIDEQIEYRNKIKGNGSFKYISWIEILFHAVPYDAMEGSEKILIKSKNLIGKTTFLSPIGKQLTGKNHHVATLGHDPVLGWIFGTMNIMSSMITFCDLQTYTVKQDVQLDKWKQSIDYLHPSNIGEMLSYCIGSVMEDYKRLPAAVARQAMHMQSDKYTKDGLPIPLLSPDKAQELINRGWNSNEMERVMKKTMKNVSITTLQFLVSEFINYVIRSIYLIVNLEDNRINQVKIERILTISSIIAECSNVGVVVATRNISRLDIGGLISMIHQIVFDAETRLEIEMDFINTEFDRLIMEDK